MTSVAATAMQDIEFVKKGQVTIPKAIRDIFNIAEGQKGVIAVVGEAIVIMPTKPRTTELFERLGEGLGVSDMSLEELIAEMRQIREDRALGH